MTIEQPTLEELAVQVKTINALLPNLATKDDIKEVLEFMKTINVGVGIFKFSWNNAGKLGSFFLLVAGIVMFFKFGLVAVWSLIIGHNN